MTFRVSSSWLASIPTLFRSPRRAMTSWDRSLRAGAAGAGRSIGWLSNLVIAVVVSLVSFVQAAVARLRIAGATRFQAIVVESDDRAMGFWNESGWARQVQRVRFVTG
jgi:hypothetical protein